MLSKNKILIFVEFPQTLPAETADDLNNTKNARMDIVFFNRVPKTGSQALMQLVKELTPINKIQTARDKAQKYETVIMGPLHQINVAEEVAEQKEPTFYSKHVAYINFTRYELPKPIYINLVRDPIERIISWYNYVRAPWYYKQLQSIFKDVKIPEKEWMELDFDTCVRQKNKLCVFEQGVINDGSSDHRRQTLFFCGHNRAECLPFNSRDVLQKAKTIVEEEYAVVGTWEEPNITLSVLEHYVPMFFKGITEVYYNKKEKFDKVNKNSLKKPVSDEVREMLRRNLTNEIEFYEFCKQRLHKQYKALRLN
ncbi:unnamed protein product [Hermetia illucens]|uniref:Heparan sulfate 2-O-sulfotransferase pipe n=1 Tax=Hermetia illucens TaxID=343691 RepID=A0A7R8ULJ8_HERIL|nr:unnamed protein product [Hermetia illucens]